VWSLTNKLNVFLYTNFSYPQVKAILCEKMISFVMEGYFIAVSITVMSLHASEMNSNAKVTNLAIKVMNSMV